MKFVYFAHSIASSWNNGNAHFQRGLALALQKLGHDFVFCEPRGNWSETNLIADIGKEGISAFERAFPSLAHRHYDPTAPNLDELTHGADVVIVHEWNEPSLITALAVPHRRYILLYHDTHHRMITAPEAVLRSGVSECDGILAFGETLSEAYRAAGWNGRVWTFHEAADTSTFYPRSVEGPQRDLVWIGNWGDEERSAELREFLIEPAKALRLSAAIYGVRFPQDAITELRKGGFSYFGWLPNHRAPAVFARNKFTVHVPRRPYARALPGIPTIRVFEALACGIPLLSAPWDDVEGLFPAGCYLLAHNGAEMREYMRSLIREDAMRAALAERGLAAIQARHTCAHRADQLLAICKQLHIQKELV